MWNSFLEPLFGTHLGTRGVPGTGFWNGASTLKQYFVCPRTGQNTTLST